MANNPAFPLYVNDLEGGTRHMTDEEFGCYLRLLIAQFNRRGILPNDEKFLSRFCTSFKESWPIVKEKFKKIDGGLMNVRLEKERLKKEIFLKKQSENGKNGGRPKKPKPFNNENPDNTQKKPLGNGYGKGNGNTEVREGMGGEEDEFPVNGFFSDTLDKKISLTEIQIGSTISYIELVCHVVLSEKDVGKRWEAFKIQNLSIHEWYNSYEKLLNHFRNSLKLEIKNNGTHKQANGRADKSGTSDARINAAEKF